MNWIAEMADGRAEREERELRDNQCRILIGRVHKAYEELGMEEGKLLVERLTNRAVWLVARAKKRVAKREATKRQ